MKGRWRGHLQSEGLSLCFCFRLKPQPFCTMAALNEARFAHGAADRTGPCRKKAWVTSARVSSHNAVAEPMVC